MVTTNCNLGNASVRPERTTCGQSGCKCISISSIRTMPGVSRDAMARRCGLSFVARKAICFVESTYERPQGHGGGVQNGRFAGTIWGDQNSQALVKIDGDVFEISKICELEMTKVHDCPLLAWGLRMPHEDHGAKINQVSCHLIIRAPESRIPRS